MVCVTAISGLLLAHASSLDPRAEHPLPVSGSGSIDNALPINDLLISALKGVLDRQVRIATPEGDLRPARGPAAIERARFRPATGSVQVLLRDALPLEVVLDWNTAQVLSVAPRHAWRWAGLHSAAALGEGGPLLSDAIAGLIVLMSFTGIWIWFRDRARTDLDRAGKVHRRAGLAAGLVLLVPAVTGVLMNHRADLGFTYRSHRELEAEHILKLTPARLPALVSVAVTFIAANVPDRAGTDVEWIDYFPSYGLVTIGFRDGTDAFLDAFSGEVRAIVPPRDTWVRQLHSGRIFGAARLVMTDLTAVMWIVVTCGGLYLAIRSGRRERLSS